ncbi:MAG TPA: helix-turn-helix domain-containing GNAT family N-acetyltransferase [Gemmatimonadales bacterium]|nr:helix-turn-helix domain-containing GNAT family N-acetyltransferase [Gemmatimonadales bacterium]
MTLVAQVRRFNRTVTRRIGALDEHFLGRHRSLGASRLLFEIGRAGIEIRALRSRLGLDSGYASRLLRSLESEGLIRIGRSPHDARARFVSLTVKGRRELRLLDQLSDAAASALLRPLAGTQRTALVSAMNTVERLLTAGGVRFTSVPPASAVARECLRRYFAELAERFEGGFDPAVSLTPADEFAPPRGCFLIASLNGQPVGCGALRYYPDVGEVKRMWVDASARGLGIGRRILGQLEARARKRGLRRVRLETNKALTEAQALYGSSGYREVSPFNDEPYAHHWFEKRL